MLSASLALADLTNPPKSRPKQGPPRPGTRQYQRMSEANLQKRVDSLNAELAGLNAIIMFGNPTERDTKRQQELISGIERTQNDLARVRARIAGGQSRPNAVANVPRQRTAAERLSSGETRARELEMRMRPLQGLVRSGLATSEQKAEYQRLNDALYSQRALNRTLTEQRDGPLALGLSDNTQRIISSIVNPLGQITNPISPVEEARQRTAETQRATRSRQAMAENQARRGITPGTGEHGVNFLRNRWRQATGQAVTPEMEALFNSAVYVRMRDQNGRLLNPSVGGSNRMRSGLMSQDDLRDIWAKLQTNEGIEQLQNEIQAFRDQRQMEVRRAAGASLRPDQVELTEAEQYEANLTGNVAGLERRFADQNELDRLIREQAQSANPVMAGVGAAFDVLARSPLTAAVGAMPQETASNLYRGFEDFVGNMAGSAASVGAAPLRMVGQAGTADRIADRASQFSRGIAQGFSGAAADTLDIPGVFLNSREYSTASSKVREAIASGKAIEQDWLNDLAKGVGSVVFSVATAVPAGGAIAGMGRTARKAASAIFSALEAGQNASGSAREAERLGVNYNDSRTRAAVGGVVDFLASSVLNRLGLFGEQAQLFKGQVVNGVANLLVRASMEGTQEGMQETIAQYVETGNVPGVNERSLYAASLGAVLGAGAGVGDFDAPRSAQAETGGLGTNRLRQFQNIAGTRTDAPIDMEAMRRIQEEARQTPRIDPERMGQFLNLPESQESLFPRFGQMQGPPANLQPFGPPTSMATSPAPTRTEPEPIVDEQEQPQQTAQKEPWQMTREDVQALSDEEFESANQRMGQRYGELYWIVEKELNGPPSSKDIAEYKAIVDANDAIFRDEAEVRIEKQQQVQAQANVRVAGGEPWAVTQNQFVRFHKTGSISDTAYEQYRTREGISWLGDKSRYPVAIGDYRVGEQTISLRQEYESGPIVAFDSSGPVGWVSSEFGVPGVWVIDEYQGKGLGVELLSRWMQSRPPTQQIGQMTSSGERMTRAYHKRIVESALKDGLPVPPEVLADYPDLAAQFQPVSTPEENNEERNLQRRQEEGRQEEGVLTPTEEAATPSPAQPAEPTTLAPENFWEEVAKAYGNPNIRAARNGTSGLEVREGKRWVALGLPNSWASAQEIGVQPPAGYDEWARAKIKEQDLARKANEKSAREKSRQEDIQSATRDENLRARLARVVESGITEDGRPLTAKMRRDVEKDIDRLTQSLALYAKMGIEPKKQGAHESTQPQHFIFVRREGKMFPIGGPYATREDAENDMTRVLQWAESIDPTVAFEQWFGKEIKDLATIKAYTDRLTKLGFPSNRLLQSQPPVPQPNAPAPQPAATPVSSQKQAKPKPPAAQTDPGKAKQQKRRKELAEQKERVAAWRRVAYAPGNVFTKSNSDIVNTVKSYDPEKREVTMIREEDGATRELTHGDAIDLKSAKTLTVTTASGVVLMQKDRLTDAGEAAIQQELLRMKESKGKKPKPAPSTTPNADQEQGPDTFASSPKPQTPDAASAEATPALSQKDLLEWIEKQIEEDTAMLESLYKQLPEIKTAGLTGRDKRTQGSLTRHSKARSVLQPRIDVARKSIQQYGQYAQSIRSGAGLTKEQATDIRITWAILLGDPGAWRGQPITVPGVPTIKDILTAASPQSPDILASPSKPPKSKDTITVDGKERPRTNSNGQPIHPTEEGIRAFWRWFSPSPRILIDGLSVSSVRSLERDVQSLGDFLESQARLPKPDRFKIIPPAVIDHVRSVATANDKVFNAVVRTIPVDVMNELTGGKFAPKELFNNPTMLKNVLPVTMDANVPLDVNSTRRVETLVRVVANFGAELTGIGGATFTDNAAVLAGKGDTVLSTQDLSIIPGFGDSKVVDEQGRPLVVYHGSPDMRFMSEDATFKSQSERFGGRGENTHAHWFASDFRTAKSYADDRRAYDYQNAKPGIISAYLQALNPLVIDAQGQYWRDAQRRGQTADVIDEARSNGHDSVIIRNVKDDYNNSKVTKSTTTLTVFSPNQIKSATGNQGTFSADEPSILASPSGRQRRISSSPTPAPSNVIPSLTPAPAPQVADPRVEARKEAKQGGHLPDIDGWTLPEPKTPAGDLNTIRLALDRVFPRHTYGRSRKGTKGTFNLRTGFTMVGYVSDTQTRVHELAHQIEKVYQIFDGLSSDTLSLIDAELSGDAFGQTVPENANESTERSERFAEWLTAYIEEPAGAAMIAPTVLEMMVESVPSQARAAIDEFSSQVQGYRALPPEQQMALRIQNPMARQTFLETLRGWFTRAFQQIGADGAAPDMAVHRTRVVDGVWRAAVTDTRAPIEGAVLRLAEMQGFQVEGRAIVGMNAEPDNDLLNSPLHYIHAYPYLVEMTKAMVEGGLKNLRNVQYMHGDKPLSVISLLNTLTPGEGMAEQLQSAYAYMFAQRFESLKGRWTQEEQSALEQRHAMRQARAEAALEKRVRRMTNEMNMALSVMKNAGRTPKQLAAEKKRREAEIERLKAGFAKKIERALANALDRDFKRTQQVLRSRLENMGLTPGETLEEVEASQKSIMAEFESRPDEWKKQIQDFAAQYRMLGDASLDILVQGGLLSINEADEVRRNNPYWISARRVQTVPAPGLLPQGQTSLADSGASQFFQKTALTGADDGINRFKGSRANIQDPVVSLMENIFEAYRAAYINKSIGGIVALAEGAGPSAGMFEDITDTDKADKTVANLQPGQSVRVYRQMPVRDSSGKAVLDDAGEPMMETKEFRYLVLDPSMQRAFRGVSRQFGVPDVPAVDAILRTLSLPKRVLQWGVVITPMFKIFNVIRDTAERVVGGRHDRSFLKVFTTKPLDEYEYRSMGIGIERGGILGNRNDYQNMTANVMRSLSPKNTILVKAGAPFRAFHNIYFGKFSVWSESVNRTIEYNAALEKAKRMGMSDSVAALWAAGEARSTGTDFARHGAVTAFLDMFIPFLNPAVQGQATFWTKAAENPKRFMVRLLAYALLGAGLEELWAMTNGTSEQRRDLPPYMRYMFWNFKLADDKWIRIPKGHELGAILALGEEARRGAAGEEMNVGGVWRSMFQTMSPITGSDMFGPMTVFIQWSANRDFFTGNTIVPEFEARTAFELRDFENSSPIAKFLANISKRDARLWDMAINETFGTVGSIATDASRLTAPDELPLSDRAMGFGGRVFGVVSRQSHTQAPAVVEVRAIMDRMGSQDVMRPFRDAYYAATSAAERQRAGVLMIEEAERILPELRSVTRQTPANEDQLKTVRADIARIRADVKRSATMYFGEVVRN